MGLEMIGEPADHLSDSNVVGDVACFDNNVGFGVSWVARLRQALQHLERVFADQKGACILSRHPSGQNCEIGLQPHRDSLGFDQGAGFRGDKRPPARGEHMRFLVQEPRDDPPLPFAERRLAQVGENVVHRATCGDLDFGIGIAKRHFQRVGQPSAHARFANTHQPHKGDGAVAQRCIAIHERLRSTRAGGLAPTSWARYDQLMRRLPCLFLALALAGSARLAAAQGVQITTLAAPDAFTTPGRDTGLPPTLWRGTSPMTARTVLALLATKPVTPAASALARRLLATGAQGPQGGGPDADLAAARATALMAQGDAKAASTILSHAPGIDRSPELARAAAESALLAGDDAHACLIAGGLSAGRDEVYWLRLRTYCQAIAGQADQAQLTFDLAQAQAKDVIFGRLMSAKLAGGGNPGPASLRNGLDLALSRSLGLDLGAAKPSAAVAAALASAAPAEPVFDAGAAPGDLGVLIDPLMKGQPVSDAAVQALFETAGSSDPKMRAKGQAGVLLAIALSDKLTPELGTLVAALSTPEGRAPLGRDLALEEASEQKLMGEAALLSLWTCADAGAAGPVIGDRVRIVRALHRVGLEADARNFALEGLLGLK